MMGVIFCLFLLVPLLLLVLGVAVVLLLLFHKKKSKGAIREKLAGKPAEEQLALLQEMQAAGEIGEAVCADLRAEIIKQL